MIKKVPKIHENVKTGKTMEYQENKKRQTDNTVHVKWIGIQNFEIVVIILKKNYAYLIDYIKPMERLF